MTRSLILPSVLFIVALAGCATSPTVATVRAAPSLHGADNITSVRLLQSGNGHAASQWSRHLIEIDPTTTLIEHDSAGEPKVRTEGRTSPLDWERLCQFISDSHLVEVEGESDLGRSSHMLRGEVTVTFDDGTQSKVTQAVWSDPGGPQLWPLIRIVEGCASHALPNDVRPEAR